MMTSCLPASLESGRSCSDHDDLPRARPKRSCRRKVPRFVAHSSTSSENACVQAWARKWIVRSKRQWEAWNKLCAVAWSA